MDEIEKIKKEKLQKMLKKGEKMQTEIEATDKDFEEKIIEQSKKVPVVVDFWAVWCPPCTILGPVLEKLAGEYKGKFILAKVNVDEARTKAQEYRIMSIPAVKLFKGGRVTAEFVGAIPEDNIKQWLDENL